MSGSVDFIELNIRYGFLFTGATIGFICFCLLGMFLRNAARGAKSLLFVFIAAYLFFHPINFVERIDEGDCGVMAMYIPAFYFLVFLMLALNESLRLKKYIKKITNSFS